MKFCPECGSIFKEGNTTCDACGYGKSDEEKKEIEKNKIQYFQEYPTDMIYDNIPVIEEDPKGISLEELKDYKESFGNIKYISYLSGTMMGKSYNKVLLFDKNELSINESNAPTLLTRKRKYKVSDENISKVKNIIIENNMPLWSKIPLRKNIAMNIGYNSMTISCDNNNYYISFDIVMDLEERKIFNDLIKLIDSFIIEDNFIGEEIIDSHLMG